MKPLFYDKSIHVNQELGYTMRMNYSYTENFELHYHNYYEFFITLSDSVVHIVNGHRQLLPEHSLVFIRPGDVHTYTKEGDFSFINITFTAETTEKLFSYLEDAESTIISSKMPPVAVLNNSEFNNIWSKINSLNTIDLNDKKQMQVKMKLIIAEIVLHLINNQFANTNRISPDWLSKLTDTAKKPDNINISLDDMSKMTNKSREHISRSFKKYYGLTASEFMTEQKLNYCANLLLNTNLPVIDICYECGFQNASWFYRKFKEKYGVTPVSFRKNAKI